MDKSYDEVDAEYRQAQLESRTEIISKTFVTDLWMKVLHRAIDDIVLYTIMRENGDRFKKEDLEFEASAHGFLFDDDYRIPMGDYRIFIVCGCGYTYVDMMSVLSNGISQCPKCSYCQEEKDTEYRIVEPQKIKDVSLKELLGVWNIEDIDGFREGTLKRIEFLIKKKKEAARKRAAAKLKKDMEMAKKKKEVAENFEEPTEDELTEFDLGTKRILDEEWELLRSKNRKYGNSATNPVRAFSKASAIEQIKVRIDDKISRLVRSTSEDEDEDVVQDLTGYLVILAALQKGYIK